MFTYVRFKKNIIDIKTEMINATTEERQALQQRCEVNKLIITSDEEEYVKEKKDKVLK